MKTLELKHIAHYLPYGLKCMYGCIMDAENDHIELMNEDNIRQILNGYGTFVIQPILRPLSDLTKEIEVNGKKFIPAEFLWGWDVKEEREFILDGKIPSIWKMNIDAEIGWWEYKHVVKLFEMHFDVFGLIEQGLAIDINTLAQ